jgi:hypothetical protein
MGAASGHARRTRRRRILLCGNWWLILEHDADD